MMVRMKIEIGGQNEGCRRKQREAHTPRFTTSRGAGEDEGDKRNPKGMMWTPAMNLNELPQALRHSMLIELARVFCRRLGRPRANDLEQAGFHDLGDLLMRGWILREPGRYSMGYHPGEAVIREMWQLDATLCSVLRLPPPLVSSVEE
jgi:hypothetical protein